MPEPRRSIGHNQTGSGERGMAAGSFRAWRSAAASIPDNVLTVVEFDTEDWDVSKWHDVVDGRFHPELAAIYRISALVQFQPVMPDQKWMYMHLRRNSAAEVLMDARMTANAFAGYVVGGSCLVRLVPGDDLELGVYQNSGSAKALEVGRVSCWWAGEVVGRL